MANSDYRDYTSWTWMHDANRHATLHVGLKFGKDGRPERVRIECPNWKKEFVEERTCGMRGPGNFSGECTECGTWFPDGQMDNYCPHCGAKVVEA